MAFSRELYELARAEMASSKARAEIEARDRQKEYMDGHPEYAEVVRELSHTGAELAKRIFANGGSADIEDIKQKNLALQRRERELLSEDGLGPDAFEPVYSCALCKDTGNCQGEMCGCVVQRMKKKAYERLNRLTPLGLCSFDTFSLSAYSEECQTKGVSPRRQMERVLAKCRDYAENFSMSSPSLLMQGGVGLGKTHLSLAIAGRVIDRGFDVIYGSAQNFLSKIDAEKFGRDTSGTDTLALLKECDLLILDDLGTEFLTSFTVSVLYDLINCRLLGSSPTVISTNLSLEGLSQRYEERILSRITGEYTRIPFVGKDVRFVLRKLGGGK